jgi:hypothetical protein
MMINLPYGGQFNENDLVAYIQSTGRNYIVQGQQAVSYVKHTKPQSLDFWLRQFAANQDTKQAENSVVNALVATGLFHIAYGLTCPDSGRQCKGMCL